VYSLRFSVKTQKILIVLALTAFVWIVFGQTAHFDWVRYDDRAYVYRSGRVTSGLSFSNIAWAFTHFHAANWHPIATLSHMFDCQIFGVNPGAHHFSSVVIHTLAAIVLFLALDSLTKKIWPSAFVAAVFAIHPLRAESVAWIAERKDVLSGLFFALTLLAWSNYARRKSVVRYLIALFAAALGVLSKPMLVTIPFVLLLIDYWPLNRFQKEKVIPLILEKIPFALFATASAVVTVLAQHGQIDTFGFSLPLRLENAIVSYAIYLRQLTWPVDLAVLYPHPERFFPFPVIAGCLALLIALSAIAIIYRKRFPFLFTGWFWFVGMLVPVIGIVQVGRQAHADRYTYLPLIGVSIAIVWLAAELTARWRFRKQIGAVVSAVVIIALSACAYHQTTFWRNADSLWPHTLAVTRNNDGAHLAFATSLFTEGKTAEAIAHARAAAAIRPANAGVYGEMPVGLEGKTLDEAILLWSARVENEPNNIGARNTFGVLLVQKHQTHAAIEQWETALALNPNDGNAQSNLAWVFATAPEASLRNGARAVELAERALKLAGGINPILHRTLAAAYAEAGRFDDAIATAERGLAFAEREGNRELADEFTAVLARYRQRQPFRDASLELHED
jgi:tetratricopeptide (TPR) repeat protein